MKLLGKLKTYKSSEITNSFVSIGFEALDRELYNPTPCYDPLGQTGVKYARCVTGWVRCEKEKGVYDFAWLDEIVDNLIARGVEPWFNVDYGNPLYMPDLPNPAAVGCVPLYYGDETLQAWKNYVAALTEHYKDRVTHYEIWNEPDSSHFWYPSEPDGREYSRLVEVTGRVIREHQPDAKIGGCVSDLYIIGYIAEFIESAPKDLLDFFCVHIYSALPEFRYERCVAHLRNLLDQNGFEKTELWQGEAGYPSWAYKGHWLVKAGCDDERPQAVWQLRRYFLDVYNGFTRSSFFQIADMWEKEYQKASEVIQKPAAHGILNGLTYTPKESYYTLRNLAAIFSGDIAPSKNCLYIMPDQYSVMEWIAGQTMTYIKKGYPVYAYYLPLELGKPLTEELYATVSTDSVIESPVLIDSYTGEVFELQREESKWGWVKYQKMPLKDYPLIICDKNAFEIEYI